jgi:hypothetical protein
MADCTARLFEPKSRLLLPVRSGRPTADGVMPVITNPQAEVTW